MKIGAIAVVLSLAAATAGAQTRATLSSDIIDTYSQMISSDPRNADLYLSRAGEYQSHGRYSQALDDLTTALECCDRNDKPLRFAILSRRATIRRITRDTDGALADLNEALSLYPDRTATLSERAALLTAKGNYDAAKTDYMNMRRIAPRDANAIFGLARIEAMNGNSDMALRYANEAVDLYPRTGSSYSGRAEIMNILNRPDEAIDQYIQAIYCDDYATGDAIQRLVDLSGEDYNAVISGFDRAILDKPTSGILYYLRGTVAAAHNHHLQALDDLTHIDNSGPFADGALTVMRAESLFSLGRYEDALKLLDNAPDKRRTATYHIVKSNVLRALARYDEAIQTASQALQLAPDHTEAMYTKALALIGGNQKSEAAQIMAEAIMTDSSNPKYYLLRAAASGDNSYLDQLLDLPYEPDAPDALRGFALLLTGKTEQADAWISSVLKVNPDTDGYASYIASCYYAQRGDSDKAYSCMQNALDRGYANAFQWISDTTPYINVGPLRTNPQFAEILERYARIFRN